MVKEYSQTLCDLVFSRLHGRRKKDGLCPLDEEMIGEPLWIFSSMMNFVFRPFSSETLTGACAENTWPLSRDFKFLRSVGSGEMRSLLAFTSLSYGLNRQDASRIAD